MLGQIYQESYWGTSMNREFKAILLLDDYSRAIIKTNISELGLHGITFINSLGELTLDLVQDNKFIIILEGYLLNNNSISDLRLYKALHELTYMYIGQDDLLAKEMESIAQVYRADVKLLDAELLQAAVYNDLALEDRNNVECGGHLENVDFATNLLKSSDDVDVKLVGLAKEFLSMRDIIEEKDFRVNQLTDRLNIIQASLDKSTSDNEIFRKNYAKIIEDTRNLNKTLEQYETILTKDIYSKINLSNYTNRPMVIYLKEYEELIHMDSFIETLYYMFINQCHKSVKVVQLFDGTGSRKMEVLPDYYHKIHGKFMIQDLVVNNFIAKSGDYTRLFEVLLTNTSNLNVLIVVDRKDYQDTVLSGSFLQLSLCRNEKNVKKFNLLPETAVVNNANESEMSWDYYENYKSPNESQEQKFIYLSSRPVIQKIYELAKFYEESI